MEPILRLGPHVMAGQSKKGLLFRECQIIHVIICKQTVWCHNNIPVGISMLRIQTLRYHIH